MDKISKELQGVISQMSHPRKRLSLSAVIESLAKKKLFHFKRKIKKTVLYLKI